MTHLSRRFWRGCCDLDASWDCFGSDSILGRLPSKARRIKVVVRQQQCPLGGIFLEQTRDQILLTGPGIGENYVKIIGIKFQFFVSIVRICDSGSCMSAYKDCQDDCGKDKKCKRVCKKALMRCQ